MSTSSLIKSKETVIVLLDKTNSKDIGKWCSYLYREHTFFKISLWYKTTLQFLWKSFFYIWDNDLLIQKKIIYIANFNMLHTFFEELPLTSSIRLKYIGRSKSNQWFYTSTQTQINRYKKPNPSSRGSIMYKTRNEASVFQVFWNV